MSSNGGRPPVGQVGGGSGVRHGQITDNGLVDLTGITLSDLRELDSDSESSLGRALRRVLASTEADGHLGFTSKI